MFKKLTVINILGDAYKETNAFEEIKKKDLLIPPIEPIFDFSIVFPAIDSIRNSFLANAPHKEFYEDFKNNPNIPKKEIDRYTKDFFLQYVFDFYESKELDSLARHYLNITDKEYKKAMRIRR